MMQVWLPAVAAAVFTEAVNMVGVAPEAGFSASQAQSKPSEVLKLSPLTGLVLATDIFCDAGTVPPIVYIPKGRFEGLGVNVGD
jgi:hypothetical protein